MLRDRLSLRYVGNDLQAFTRLGHTLQTEYFNRRCWSCFSDRLTAIVEHSPDLAGDLPDDERVVNPEGALLDQHRADRTASAIQFRFKHDTGSETCRAGAQVQ